jgi:hypothetical protein
VAASPPTIKAADPAIECQWDVVAARRGMASVWGRNPNGLSTLRHVDRMSVDKSGWRAARLGTSPLCGTFRTFILNLARGG